MTDESYPSDCDTLASRTIVRGADAAWIEDRAAEAEAARASWRGWDWSTLELRGRDFRGAFLASVDLRGANLTGCRLDRAVLAGADLRDTILEGVSARGADLRGASLARALIREADFGDADFGEEPGGRGEPAPDEGSRFAFRPQAVERGFDFRDVNGRCLAVVVAPDWPTAIFRLARERGATRLTFFDSSRRPHGNRETLNTHERRCAGGRAGGRARPRGERLCQDE
jgi:uncharacterized protein YjbI with pentapeptide repeats